MSLSRIIKRDEVQSCSLHTLPLRNYKTVEEPAKAEPATAEEELSQKVRQVIETAEAKAGEIISKARAEASEIISQARAESEQIKRQVHQTALAEGRREGTEKGYREGKEKAREEANTIRAQATEVLNQAEEIRRRTLAGVEQEVVDLAREIAEKFIQAQLALEPETVLSVVEESLRLVAGRFNVVLYVSPEELELYEGKKEHLRSFLRAGDKLQVIVDPAIQPGGCRIETDQGRVDATLEARKETLLKAFYGRE